MYHKGILFYSPLVDLPTDIAAEVGTCAFFALIASSQNGSAKRRQRVEWRKLPMKKPREFTLFLRWKRTGVKAGRTMHPPHMVWPQGSVWGRGKWGAGGKNISRLPFIPSYMYTIFEGGGWQEGRWSQQSQVSLLYLRQVALIWRVSLISENSDCATSKTAGAHLGITEVCPLLFTHFTLFLLLLSYYFTERSAHPALSTLALYKCTRTSTILHHLSSLSYLS